MVEYKSLADEELKTKPERKQKTASDKALLILSIIMGTGLLAVFMFALQVSSRAEFISYSLIGIMIAGSSSILGSLLGFLFGIPRTLQNDDLAQIRNANNSENDSDKPKTDYRANTNLEQISDWLTKILVGVGLTQIANIPATLQQISYFAAVGLGNTEGSRTFALTTILFFLVSGFLFGYLWTRLYLPGAFREADLSSLENQVQITNSQVKQVNKKLEEIERQAQLDAMALSAAQKQLNPVTDAPPIKQEQLTASIKVSSIPVKVQIFNLAQNLRASNWDIDKTRMELTIPIFKALTEDDTRNKFHRNHGQLGYALKDKVDPDWVGALNEFNKAIEIRGSWQENGYTFYEMNRAICRINLDENFKLDKTSKPEEYELILLDLQAATHSKSKRIIITEPSIKKWLTLNNVSIDKLFGK